jgi:2-oxoglutarate dehydrogenase E1 component
MFTQPQMYKVIKKHQNPMERYSQKLIDENTITKEEYDSMQAEFLKKLDDSYEQSKDYNPEELDWLK